MRRRWEDIIQRNWSKLGCSSGSEAKEKTEQIVKDCDIKSKPVGTTGVNMKVDLKTTNTQLPGETNLTRLAFCLTPGNKIRDPFWTAPEASPVVAKHFSYVVSGTTRKLQIDPRP